MVVRLGLRHCALCLAVGSFWPWTFSLLSPSTGEQRFLIARHGETTFNAEKRFQGSMDEGPVLTAKGISQAEELGKWLKVNPVSAVYVSPLLRARQTLEVARTIAGDSIPATATVLPELREIDLHEWEGQTQDEIRAQDPESMRLWKEESWNLQISGRYVVRDLWHRAAEAWKQMLQEDAPAGRSLIVAHGALGKALLSTALGLPEQAFRHFAISNGEVREVAWQSTVAGDSKARWRKLHPNEGPWRCLDDEKQAMQVKRGENVHAVDAA